MKLLALLGVLFAESKNDQGRSSKGRISAEELRAGNVRPNKNLLSVNNLSGVGCRMVEIQDPYYFAVSQSFFNRFNNCGREMIIK